MSKLEQFFETFMSSPVFSMILSIVGTLVTIFTMLSKIRSSIKNMTDTNIKADETTKILSSKIDSLDNAQSSLEETRSDFLTLKNDVKELKQALKLLALNIPNVISEGAGKQIADILKEVDEAKVVGEASNEEKQN
ncbi:MAG: hypothetical protein ACI4WW_02560 [Candidatus Coprovivens sp.]